MSGVMKWRPLQVLRGRNEEGGRDGRRDIYLSVNIGIVSFFLAIKPEHVEHLRESLAEYDETEPEPDIDAAAAKGEWDANVMGPER